MPFPGVAQVLKVAVEQVSYGWTPVSRTDSARLGHMVKSIGELASTHHGARLLAVRLIVGTVNVWNEIAGRGSC